jgi:hypothetical protein
LGQLARRSLILLGTAVYWIVNPLFGWVFLGFSAVSIYVIIRRLLCNSCYYCKSCTKGFAKMSILFLGTNQIPGLSKSSVLVMTSFIYVVLLVIPGFVLANSILMEFTWFKFILLTGLLAFSMFAIASRVKNRNQALWKPSVSK